MPAIADEISEWARRLGGGADNEGRLQNLVTYWFAQASSLIQVSQAAGNMTGVEPAGRHRYKGGEGRPGGAGTRAAKAAQERATLGIATLG
jgi:hypothetical protein